MKHIILLIFTLLLSAFAYANESKVCQKCHPIIYDEYYGSSHRKASVYNNPIHKAFWDKHPKDEKGYTCAKCHSPSDTEVMKTGVLQENAVQKEEPISCIYCHTIKDIEEDQHSNSNILNGKKRNFYTAEKDMEGTAEFKKESSFFGLITEPKSSPYHKIDYSNENYYSGNVCMGCHSHVNNEHNFDITMLDAMIDEKDKNSCITCHMPQILGSKVTINETKTHAYHGIAGIYHMNKKMGEFIEFKVSKTDGGFTVTVINKANHALFGQALREGKLKVRIERGPKSIELKPFIFSRILAKDGKEAMPWEANGTLKDTLIYAKKEISYQKVLEEGDRLVLTLGVQLLSDKAAKELKLENNEEVTKFRILKTGKFDF